MFSVSAHLRSSDLATAAITYVGQSALSAAIGSTSLIDVHTWIREAVDELEQYFSRDIRAALNEQRLQILIGDMNALKTTVAHFAAIPSSRQNSSDPLLAQAFQQSNSLYNQSKDFPIALTVTAIAITYRVIVSLTYFKLDRIKEKLEVTNQEVTDYLNYVQNAIDNFNQIHNPLRRVSVEEGCEHGDGVKFHCYALIDGKPYQPSYFESSYGYTEDKLSDLNRKQLAAYHMAYNHLLVENNNLLQSSLYQLQTVGMQLILAIRFAKDSL